MGRPLKWFHYSENPPGVNDWQLQDAAKEQAIATAYIGCQDCEIEIEKELSMLGSLFVRTQASP
jgi:hypothetical protein